MPSGRLARHEERLPPGSPSRGLFCANERERNKTARNSVGRDKPSRPAVFERDRVRESESSEALSVSPDKHARVGAAVGA